METERGGRCGGSRKQETRRMSLYTGGKGRCWEPLAGRVAAVTKIEKREKLAVVEHLGKIYVIHAQSDAAMLHGTKRRH